MDSRTLQDVQSEVIALEAVLIAVFRRIARADPRMAKLLCDSFDEAETVMAGTPLGTACKRCCTRRRLP
jgi:hypothetical protein